MSGRSGGTLRWRLVMVFLWVLGQVGCAEEAQGRRVRPRPRRVRGGGRRGARTRRLRGRAGRARTVRSSGRPARRRARPRRFVQYGLATWYGRRFRGRKTASGEIFDERKLTAAHRTLPFGTVVRVTRLDTHRSVVVRINDRGPYGKGRIIDLSRAAAARLGMLSRGVVRVRLQVLRWGGGRRGTGGRRGARRAGKRRSRSGRPVLMQTGFGRRPVLPRRDRSR